MNNFIYHNPVKIVFGKETISQLAELIPGDKKVMLIYGGGSIKNNGVYDQVLKALSGRTVTEFGGIEPNPVYETCLQAVARAKSHDVSFLLAVGGGSVLDATKFIAAAMAYEGGDPWEILLSFGEKVMSAVPLGVVLTLPATGSEMNGYSVISRKSSQEKLAFYSPQVYPRFSILDPEVTYSLPSKQLRNGIVDTLVHVLEQYATYEVHSPLQDRQSEAIILTLVELAERILRGEKDYDARASFMWCATQALNGSISCGVIQDWSTHMIGHELTAFFGLDHAESLAVVMPALWRHQKQHKKGKLAQLAERVWGVHHGTTDQKADAAIEKMTAFFHAIGMPTRLRDFNIAVGDTEKVVARFEKRATILGEHQNITFKEIREILSLGQ